MALQDPLLFLGLGVATFIGFVLRAVANHDPSREHISNSPMMNTVMQIIFLSVLTILWLVLISN
ncbi:MAG: hypothetical protein ACP5N2_01695 [Candidatus Nanoarchaeia archaeon]